MNFRHCGFGGKPFMNPHQVGPAQMMPNPLGPSNVLGAQYDPPQMMPTQVAPTQVSPTQQFVKTNLFNTVVPHVHPSHTTIVNKQLINHQHYFPHTQSVVNQCFEKHTVCGCPPRPFGMF